MKRLFPVLQTDAERMASIRGLPKPSGKDIEEEPILANRGPGQEPDFQLRRKRRS